MLNYIYDGSFEGLLTAIYEAYYTGEVPENILTEGIMQTGIFDRNILISTDAEKAKKVYDSIKTKISPLSLEHAFHAFLSGHDSVGTWIYHYLKFGWKIGKQVDMYLSDPRVLKIHDLSRKATFECHRMLGLLRFMEIDDGLFYASMEPDNDIIRLIAPHFERRLSDQNWIIHDIKRCIAAVYNQNECIISSISVDYSPPVGEVEARYQKLWKEYFKKIAIQNRVNPTLQKQFMPVRYWKHLTEKQ